jgi:3-deoxy-D-manno-octulosonate 8-phosphate phosphatase KdsC-like HAD superfamily phosphatase
VDDPVPAVSATVTDTVLDAPVVTEVGLSVTVTDVDRAEMLIVVLIADARPLLDAITV